MISTQYSAFISYRHQSPDQEIAKKLHRLIETYSVPSALRKDGARHPGKVFRDQEELPLSSDLGKDIETALDNSEWLICICSPRYLESRWCQRELEYFIERKGRDHILTVLAEGEPGDSFPELLRFETDENGNRIEREPLAADVRGTDLAEILKKLKKEKYRILAPMVGTSFDGLYQRQRRRTMRNVLAAALAAVAILGGFLTYALIQNGKITAQNEQIKSQNEKISTQNTELTEKNEQIEKQNSELTEKNEQIEKQNTELSEKNEQIEAQNTELTKKNEQIEAQNVRIEEERVAAARNECDLLVEKSVYYSSVNRKMEATRLGLEALAVSETLDGYAKDSIREALAVSCSMGDFAVEAELDFPGIVNYDPSCCFSPDGSKLAVADSRSGLSLCDTATGERLWVSSPFSHDITSVHWKEDSSLLVVTAQWGHTVCLVDAATGEHLKDLYIPWACNAVFDGDNVLIAFAQGIIRWEPAVSDENFPWVYQVEEDQHATSKCLLNERFISFCQGITFTKPRIFVKETGSDDAFVIELESNKVVSGYTLSPDGEWIFVHQFDQCMVINLLTDEIRWQITREEGLFSGSDCGPVWTGNIILDCGKAYDAMTGEVLYDTKNQAYVGVFPDGQFFADSESVYRLSDGSWFADIPGNLKAIDPTGKHLVVYHTLEYGRGAPGNPDAVISRKQTAYLEKSPGTGSQYIAEQYNGTLLDIPDFTEPEHEEGTIFALNDPYGTTTTGYLQAKSFFSPNNGRFYLVINQGAYIPIYDLEKSNEPSSRIYDFSIGDHVEAKDVGFSADGRLAAVAGANGQVAVYELETGSMVCSYTDTYLARSLSEVRFNASGSYLMVADFNLSSFRVYSVTNGQTLYVMHAVKEVDSWGFDEQTGDAVIKYTDGSALIARMFEDEETLLSYARETVK
uniref:Putative WD repeat-containing protein n=1 Tax=uncultured bacterium Contig52 TaxID=1393584 RepID=W0FJL8_9BACT|nr:putative WD repeat-containing protein [uncultured bacterium Contig52]